MRVLPDMIKTDYKPSRRFHPSFYLTKRDLIVGFSTAALCFAFSLSAEEWKENTDGEMKPHEYRIVDAHGAVTRAACPYSCSDRGIPKESCKEWKSITHSLGGECYVQDLRVSKNDAMPESTASEVKKTTSQYKGK